MVDVDLRIASPCVSFSIPYASSLVAEAEWWRPSRRLQRNPDRVRVRSVKFVASLKGNVDFCEGPDFPFIIALRDGEPQPWLGAPDQDARVT